MSPQSIPVSEGRASIRTCLFAGAANRFPAERVDFDSFSEFAGALEELTTREAEALKPEPDESQGEHVKRVKRSLPYLAPYHLPDERDKSRCDANVSGLTLLMGDVDACDLNALIDRMFELDVDGVIYGSPSDSEELAADKRRVRVVVPISREILPQECSASRLAFAELLGLAPGCGADMVPAPSIGFFAGRMPGAPERDFYHFEGGKSIDVDALLARPLAHAWGTPGAHAGAERGAADKSPLPPIGEVDPRDAETLVALLALHLPAGTDPDRRMRLRATGNYLAQRGLSEERIAALVSRIPTARGPQRSVAEAIGGARDRRAGVVNVVGWQMLEALNPEAAATLERAVEGKFERRNREKREAQAKHAAADPFAPAADNDNAEGGALGTPIDLSTPIQKLRYLCEGLGIAFDGKCAAVHGYAGSSKGLFLSMIALCVASGTPVFGQHAVTRVPVVYGDAETGVLAEIRLKRLALALKIDLGALQREGWFRFHRLTQSLPESLAGIESTCKALDKGEGTMLALDSYSSLVAGDENKSEYADPMWELGRMGSRVNAVPVVTMHERKGDRESKGGKPNPLEGISGTNRLAAALATSIRLTPSEDDDRVITVTCTRAPEKRFAPVSLTWVDVGAGLSASTAQAYIPNKGEIAERKAADRESGRTAKLESQTAAAERKMLFRLASLPPGDSALPAHAQSSPSLTMKKLAEAAGVHPSKPGDGDAPAIIQRLVADGWLVADDGGQRYTEYQLRDPLPVQPKTFGGFSTDDRTTKLLAEVARARAIAKQ